MPAPPLPMRGSEGIDALGMVAVERQGATLL